MVTMEIVTMVAAVGALVGGAVVATYFRLEVAECKAAVTAVAAQVAALSIRIGEMDSRQRRQQPAATSTLVSAADTHRPEV